MFDIGFQELIIIFFVALFVFGPEKLPKVGRTIGGWLGDVRRGIEGAKMQIDAEFSGAERMDGDKTCGMTVEDSREHTGKERAEG